MTQRAPHHKEDQLSTYNTRKLTTPEHHAAKKTHQTDEKESIKHISKLSLQHLESLFCPR
jgi:hypothetical protein